MRTRVLWASALVSVLLVTACASVLQRRLIPPSELRSLPPGVEYLKAHMKSGDLLVLSAWTVDSVARTISGTGQRFNFSRQALDSGSQVVALDSVALLESNVIQPHTATGALVVVTLASAAVTAVCIIDPKTCFGSCPTFYVDDGSPPVISAEGFSASVAPALEASDVDALYRARPTSRRFTLRMTNEALETHVVRWASVLAAERPAGGRVYATQDGQFWRSTAAEPPTRCTGPEGDCLGAVRALDDVERFSVADSTDLAAREWMDLEFPAVAGDTLGLVIGSRQTLLSTFVLYQALAYMGRNASAWLAALERHDRVRGRADAIGRVLGGIEVQAQDRKGRWKTLGATQETGPIATDLRVVVLRDLAPGTTRLRLRLTKGHWRIDYLALARLDGRVKPKRLDPVRVTRGEAEDANALAALHDSSRTLVTMPGDEYRLEYELPERFQDQELFLESRGYYLEWMRKEWMAEENAERAAAMFLRPEQAMRDLAPEFKKREAGMEDAFWKSRYVRH